MVEFDAVGLALAVAVSVLGAEVWFGWLVGNACCSGPFATKVSCRPFFDVVFVYLYVDNLCCTFHGTQARARANLRQ